jgi:hypothetical protein
MGEVYRARDTKLKRDVALKVLPAAFVGDPERMARFQREAEVLASLNHPNIAAIYGVEHDEATHALAMEFVDGASPKGPMGFEDAWNIAAQIAAALEYAHDKGIIHRDLKPANVKVTPDGAVKLLDFGLAKAFTARAVSDSGPGSGNGAPAAENSPTLTMGATEAGMILGTAAYMSPEQAKGKNVDKRADIWAFGVVLYELLSGTRPFHGDDVGDVLASVIKDQPALDKVPAQARPLIESCLEKDPKKRLRDIGDAHCLLNRDSHGAGAASAGLSAPLWSRFHLIPWGVTALLLITAVALGFVHFREAPPAAPSYQFQIPPPPNTRFGTFRLSPDGRSVVFTTAGGAAWIRSLDALESQQVQGSEGAEYPFWSPDGTFVAYYQGGKLKKASVKGGPPQTICDATGSRGGAWGPDGTILFSDGPTSPILRVPASGGKPAPVTKLSETGSAGVGHRAPAFLPDGRHFLFETTSTKAEEVGVYVGSLDGGTPVHVLHDDGNATFGLDPGGKTGHLFFRREGTLMAIGFDPDKFATVGEAFPVAADVAIAGNNQYGAFSSSPTGVIAYWTGAQFANRELTWMDVSGKSLGTVGPPGAYGPGKIALSPDEKTIVASRGQTVEQSDLWLFDAAGKNSTRFTFGVGGGDPVWTNDGASLIYSKRNTVVWDIVRRAVNGGVEETLLKQVVNAQPNSISPDGKQIAYYFTDAKTGYDIGLLNLDGKHETSVYLATPAAELYAHFSPDGNWMAYESNESGRYQIYVQSIPIGRGKFQLSITGGTFPQWRHDGKELYYISADQKLMSVPVRINGSKLEPGTPKELFPVPGATSFVVTRDGQRFLVNRPAGGESAAAPPLTVVTNWQAALKK